MAVLVVQLAVRLIAKSHMDREMDVIVLLHRCAIVLILAEYKHVKILQLQNTGTAVQQSVNAAGAVCEEEQQYAHRADGVQVLINNRIES